MNVPLLRARVLGHLLAIALLAAAAVAAWWPVYRDARFLILAVVTVLAGVAIAVAGWRWNWRAPIVATVVVGFVVVAGVPLAVPSRAAARILPTPDGIVELARGAVAGWRELVTISLPVGSYESLLVPVFLLLTLSSVIAASIALRARWTETAVVPFLAVMVFGIAFGPDSEALPRIVVVGAVIVALLYVVWSRSLRERAALHALAERVPELRRPVGPSGIASVSVRTLLASAAILAVASSGAVAASAAFPVAGDREVVRSVVVQPFEPREHSSPLSGFRRYLQPEHRDSVMLIASGLQEGDRIRIATLDVYDGVVYTVGGDPTVPGSSRFERVAVSVDRSELAGERATVELEVGAQPGPWLPTVGAIEAVEFFGDRSTQLRRAFFVNTETGTAAITEPLRSGESYRIDAVREPLLPVDELAQLTPGNSDSPRVSTVPDEVTTVVERHAASLLAPGPRLSATIEGLVADGYLGGPSSSSDVVSRSGHGLDRIGELLSSQPMVGDAEQYAVAAALMADAIGFPARVVIGFAPESDPDPVEILGEDIAVWVEVQTAQLGWVGFDPVPEDRPIPDAPPEELAELARPSTVVPPPPADEPPVPIDPAISDADSAAEAPGSPLLRALAVIGSVLGVVVIIAAILISPFVVVLALKARRRRRRFTRGSPRARLRAGWSEMVDNARDYGFEPGETATRSEVAMVLATPRSHVLAAAVDRATFGPDDPIEIDVRKVWDVVDEIVDSFAASRTRWDRLRARVSLRSLRHNG